MIVVKSLQYNLSWHFKISYIVFYFLNFFLYLPQFLFQYFIHKIERILFSVKRSKLDILF